MNCNVFLVDDVIQQVRLCSPQLDSINLFKGHQNQKSDVLR